MYENRDHEGDAFYAMKYFQNQLLPCEEFDRLWERTFVPADIKSQLVAYARLISSIDGECSVSTGINRFVYLAGSPGVGKTTLAKGFANQLAKIALQRGLQTQLFEANAETWRSENFGQTGKEIKKAFEDLRIAASSHQVVLLVDEVESIAIARVYTLSSNEPSDAVNAVNILLAELDRFADKHFLLLATSNFEEALDSALRSRADLEIEVPLPDYQARHAILADTSVGFRRTGLELSPEGLSALAKKTQGFSGRALRKLFLQVLCQTAKPSNEVIVTDFLETIDQIKDTWKGEKLWK